MKSSTYILKRPHLERQQEYEYRNHSQRVQKIESSFVDPNKVLNLDHDHNRNTGTHMDFLR